MDSGRRSFLRGALLTRDGRSRESRRQQALGPAPPWHIGLKLEAFCSGCPQPCISACAPGIIAVHPADHELAGIPYLDFHRGGCTFCAACIEACPIDIDTASATRPVIGTAKLNRERCIAWGDVICMSCHSRCEYQAISLEHQRRARIDSDRCTGCGMCIDACPVDALCITGSS
jgi:ferredoxin-type protein NapF